MNVDEGKPLSPEGTTKEEFPNPVIIISSLKKDLFEEFIVRFDEFKTLQVQSITPSDTPQQVAAKEMFQSVFGSGLDSADSSSTPRRGPKPQFSEKAVTKFLRQAEAIFDRDPTLSRENVHHLLDFLRYNVSAYTVEYFVRARRRFLFAKLNTLITETSQATALKKPSSSQPTTVVHVNPAEDDEAIQSLKEAPADPVEGENTSNVLPLDSPTGSDDSYLKGLEKILEIVESGFGKGDKSIEQIVSEMRTGINYSKQLAAAHETLPPSAPSKDSKGDPSSLEDDEKTDLSEPKVADVLEGLDFSEVKSFAETISDAAILPSEDSPLVEGLDFDLDLGDATAPGNDAVPLEEPRSSTELLADPVPSPEGTTIPIMRPSEEVMNNPERLALAVLKMANLNPNAKIDMSPEEVAIMGKVARETRFALLTDLSTTDPRVQHYLRDITGRQPSKKEMDWFDLFEGTFSRAIEETVAQRTGEPNMPSNLPPTPLSKGEQLLRDHAPLLDVLGKRASTELPFSPDSRSAASQESLDAIFRSLDAFGAADDELDPDTLNLSSITDSKGLEKQEAGEEEEKYDDGFLVEEDEDEDETTALSNSLLSSLNKERSIEADPEENGLKIPKDSILNFSPAQQKMDDVDLAGEIPESIHSIVEPMEAVTESHKISILHMPTMDPEHILESLVQNTTAKGITITIQRIEEFNEIHRKETLNHCFVHLASAQEVKDMINTFGRFGIFIHGWRCAVISDREFVSLMLKPRRWFTPLTTEADVRYQLERVWGIAGIDAIEIPQREDRNLGTIYLNFTSHLNAYNALNLINTEYKLHFYEATWASVSPERERKLNQELSDEDIEFYELSEKPAPLREFFKQVHKGQPVPQPPEPSKLKAISSGDNRVDDKEKGKESRPAKKPPSASSRSSPKKSETAILKDYFEEQYQSILHALQNSDFRKDLAARHLGTKPKVLSTLMLNLQKMGYSFNAPENFDQEARITRAAKGAMEVPEIDISDMYVPKDGSKDEMVPIEPQMMSKVEALLRSRSLIKDKKRGGKKKKKSGEEAPTEEAEGEPVVEAEVTSDQAAAEQGVVDSAAEEGVVDTNAEEGVVDSAAEQGVDIAAKNTKQEEL